MSELSKFLVENILLGEASSVKDLVVVYSGRFQPFHKGHFNTYQTLVKKFGKNNVYIGTSDKTDNQKSPFNFKEKVKVMTTMFGIPSNKIVQVKNPYAPTEILNKFNKETTGFITVVGEKDSNRLGGKYFEKYKDGIEMEGYMDRGYVFISPSQSNAVSGTDVRVGLRKGSIDDKKEFFTKRAYGKFNQSIFDMIVDKLTKLPEITESNIYIPIDIIESWLVDNVDLVVEATLTMGKTAVDDGPNFVFPSYASFDKISKSRAERIGYTVLAQIMSDELTDIDSHPIYPNGPVKAVTPFPAGVIGKTTATNQKDYYGSTAYNLWLKHISRIAGMVGYSLVDSLENTDDKEEALKTTKIPDLKLPNVDESITLDVEIGDTLLMGKFKNKRVVVKSIGEDEHGMPTVNGKKVATFRIMKEGIVNESDIVRLNNTLGIDREELPQIPNESIDDYLQHLKSANVTFETGTQSVASLNTSQSKIDLDKIKNIMKSKTNINPIIVSSDDYILDGHHRALAAYNTDKKCKIPTIKVALPIDELIEISNQFNGSVNQPISEGSINEIPMADLRKIDTYADKQLNPMDVVLTDRHFFDRLNDPRNGKEISAAELTGFFKRLGKEKKKFIEFLAKYDQIVAKDARTNINIPFMLQANKVIAKTIMRKDNFKTSTPEYQFEISKDTNVSEAYTKGNIFGGKIKIGGVSVPLEVELIGVDNTKNVFITKVVHIDSKYHSKLPSNGMLEIPAKIFRTPGGGWYKIKTQSAFEGIGMGYPDQEWVDKHNVILKKLRTKFNAEKLKNDEQYTLVGEINEKVEGGKVICDKCGWNWKISEGGSDTYMCHKCGNDNTPNMNEGVGTSIMLVGVLLQFISMMFSASSGSGEFSVGRFWDTIKQKKDLFVVKRIAKRLEGDSDIQAFLKSPNSKQRGGWQKLLLTKLKEDEIKYFKVLHKKYFTKSTNEGILTEGGAYGHMHHPFDTEINLTFGQLKNIVNLALEGKLELTREKTDGQALAISWVNGRLVAARNKGHLANKGENALDISGVATKFAGRGELEKAYNFAMNDLSKAVKSLSEKQREKIFKNGACFMNLEVIYPTSVNVIPYGQALLVFHGTMEYNDAGVAIGENQDAAKILAGMIKQVNQNVQSAYTIQGPPVVKLPQSKDLSALKGKYKAEINKLQSKFKLSDSDGIADYHQAWWTDFVTKKSPSPLDNRTLMGLVKRWAFYDKTFRLDTKNIEDSKVLDWAKGIDKNDHAKIAKDNIRPFEDIFLGVGSEVLSFMSSVLTVNSDSAVRAMKDRLDKTISDVKSGGDEKKIAKLKMELQRLNAIGGKNKIVPNEGIVFVYNGNTMKLTGTFAPLNQILGLFYE